MTGEDLPVVKAHLRDPFRVVAIEDIRDFEAEIGGELPADYREFLLNTNGGVYHDYVCTTSGFALSDVFGLDSGFEWSDLRWNRVIPINQRPPNTLPIASGPGGDYACLKIAPPDSGSVLAVSHDGSFVPYRLASSFTEFFESVILDPEALAGEVHSDPSFRAIDLDDIPSLSGQLNGGLKVDHSDADGKTLLMHAAWRSRLEIVDYLIEQDADINARDNRGCSVAFYAVFTHSPGCLTALVNHGAGVNDNDNEGQSMLMYAVSHDSVRCVEKLIALGANIEYSAPDGSDARSRCGTHQEEIRQILVKAKGTEGR